MTRIAITGAGGFLGRAIQKRARAAPGGPSVLALTRRGADGTTAVDLGAGDAPERLAPLLGDVDAVIHTAAALTGDAAAHERDTVRATAHLIAALQARARPPRLLLVSSLSVYDIPALADHARLDETGPVIAARGGRDAYAWAKMQQERLVAASGLGARILRPGAIYGPGRLWSAQLGFARGGVVLCPGAGAEIPAIAHDRVAEALLALADPARAPDLPPDLPADLPPGPINLIDPDPPTRGQWISALGLRPLPVPLRAVTAAGALIGRGAKWQARFRPLRHDTTATRALIGPLPGGFAAAIAAARQQETPP